MERKILWGERVEINEITAARLLEEIKTVYIKSKFGFLQSHLGLRPGKMHLLLSTSGAGKSSLTRALMKEVATNHKISIYLSEESTQDFQTYLAQAAMPERCIKNMTLFSERDEENCGKSSAEMFDAFAEFAQQRADVFFFDNITTSLFYNNKANAVQSAVARKIKQMTAKMGYAMFIVAHTATGVSDYNQQILTVNDLRGDKTLSNEMEFFYGFQRFRIGEESFAVIRVLKSRNPSSDWEWFELDYSQSGKIYTGDRKITFAELKEGYNARNRLGGK